jgi:hypothetical protein
MFMIEDLPAGPIEETRQKSGINVQENAPQQPGKESAVQAGNTNPKTEPAPVPKSGDPVVAEAATKECSTNCNTSERKDVLQNVSQTAPENVSRDPPKVPVDGHFHSPGNEAKAKIQVPFIGKSSEIQGGSRNSEISPAAATGPAPTAEELKAMKLICDKCDPPREVPIVIWNQHETWHRSMEKKKAKDAEKAKGKKKTSRATKKGKSK